jgi:hypothetical protein
VEAKLAFHSPRLAASEAGKLLEELFLKHLDLARWGFTFSVPSAGGHSSPLLGLQQSAQMPPPGPFYVSQAAVDVTLYSWVSCLSCP